MSVVAWAAIVATPVFKTASPTSGHVNPLRRSIGGACSATDAPTRYVTGGGDFRAILPVFGSLRKMIRFAEHMVARSVIYSIHTALEIPTPAR